MKQAYLFLFCFLFFIGCRSQNNVQIINEFIQSYNNKDSIKTFNLLCKDFIELWEKDTVINTKMDYFKNFNYGKVMNDSEEIEVTKTDANFVETISTYYSARDKLLEIKPFKSKRIYEISEGEIIKIIGEEFDGYEEYEKSRKQKYQVFFKWLSENYGLGPADFPFDKTGAEELKKLLIEYQRN